MRLSEGPDAVGWVVRQARGNPNGVDESDRGRPSRATTGDVIVVGGHHVGGEWSMGEFLEVLGEPGHERYRVRWDDGHESILQPADGDATIHQYSPRGASAELVRGLSHQGIAFEPLRHPRSETARDEALTLHTPAEQVAKSIVVRTPKDRRRVVIPASQRLALGKLRDATGSVNARLASEPELTPADQTRAPATPIPESPTLRRRTPRSRAGVGAEAPEAALWVADGEAT